MKEQLVHINAPQSEMEIRPFCSLNLADDFMFDAATDNLECCQIILELSLGIRIKNIRWRENQSLIDAPLLKSGEEAFDGLKPSLIVGGCDFDLYGRGKYRYTFTNQCKEIPGLELGDESTKIVLNTRGTDGTGAEQGLIDFLHYIPDSTERQISEHTNWRLRRLHEVIESLRRNSEMEAAYMKAETREREMIADAKGEGWKERTLRDIKSLMGTLGLTAAQAMDALQIPESEQPEYDLLVRAAKSEKD